MRDLKYASKSRERQLFMAFGFLCPDVWDLQPQPSMSGDAQHVDLRV